MAKNNSGYEIQLQDNINKAIMRYREKIKKKVIRDKEPLENNDESTSLLKFDMENINKKVMRDGELLENNDKRTSLLKSDRESINKKVMKDGEPLENAEESTLSLEFDRENLIQGILFSEILGKPRAKRKRR